MSHLKLYTKFLNKNLKISRPLKIVCDASNGTVGPVLKETFKNNKKIKLILINQKSDGNFPAHGPNPLAKGAMDETSKRVIKEKADLGAVFDADADRVFFVDDKGNQLPSYLSSIVLFEASKPPFIADELVYQSLRFLKIFSRKDLLPSKVGSYFVKVKMKEIKANVSAEYSGHFYFKDFFYADSGMLALIKMCNFISSSEDIWTSTLVHNVRAKTKYRSKVGYISKSGQLSEFIEKLPEFSIQTSEIKNADVGEYEKKLQKIAREKKAKIEKRDGITLIFENGFLNLRPSNTEPIIRVTCGARTEEEGKEIINFI